MIVISCWSSRCYPPHNMNIYPYPWTNVGLAGILALGSKLPRIKFLKQMYLGQNYWDINCFSSRSLAACLAALLNGATDSDSIEYSDPASYHEKLEYCFQNNRVPSQQTTQSRWDYGLWYWKRLDHGSALRVTDFRIIGWTNSILSCKTLPSLPPSSLKSRKKKSLDTFLHSSVIAFVGTCTISCVRTVGAARYEK